METCMKLFYTILLTCVALQPFVCFGMDQQIQAHKHKTNEYFELFPTSLRRQKKDLDEDFRNYGHLIKTKAMIEEEKKLAEQLAQNKALEDLFDKQIAEKKAQLEADTKELCKQIEQTKKENKKLERKIESVKQQRTQSMQAKSQNIEQQKNTVLAKKTAHTQPNQAKKELRPVQIQRKGQQILQQQLAVPDKGRLLQHLHYIGEKLLNDENIDERDKIHCHLNSETRELHGAVDDNWSLTYNMTTGKLMIKTERYVHPACCGRCVQCIAAAQTSSDPQSTEPSSDESNSQKLAKDFFKFALLSAMESGSSS